MTISFTLPLVPVAKGRPRFGLGRVFTDAKTVRFERAVASMSRKYAPSKPLAGPLELTIRFIVKRPKRPEHHMPAVRPDIDNLIKSVSDGLNGVMWTDDAQVCRITASKLYDLTGNEPRIEIEIRAIPKESARGDISE